MGFDQWNDDFGGGKNFLGSVITNCSNLDQIKNSLTVFLGNKNISSNFEHKDSNTKMFSI